MIVTLTGFRPPQQTPWSRQLMEISIMFVMAVITLRGFFLEGYLITTGSMAPGLLGLHKQVQCPDCHFSFAFGVRFDDSIKRRSADQDAARQYATCPNCGQSHINTENIPLNHGDQLLVHKGVFQLRHPRRWEAIVFRNPDDPGEAYVKRAIGLPKESIRVAQGDVFVNGVIATKPLEIQRDCRIAVSDMDYLATSDDWRFPWKAGPGWDFANGEFVFPAKPSQSGGASAEESLTDRHLDYGTVALDFHRRSGGQHVSEVAISENELSPDQLNSEWNLCLKAIQSKPMWWLTRIEIDRERRIIRQRGVMPMGLQKALISASSSQAFRRAIFRLAALSHQAPVTDRYGYNSVVPSPEYPIRDLATEIVFRATRLPEFLEFRVPVGHLSFRVLLKPLKLVATIQEESSRRILRTTKLETAFVKSLLSENGLRLEVSNFDHRLIVAADESLIFAPLDIPIELQAAVAADQAASTASQTVPTANGLTDQEAGQRQARAFEEFKRQQGRWQFRTDGGELRVTELRLYRDVYYTPGRGRHAVNSNCVVPDNRYFVLGDNSPVSSDSRSWKQPFVPDRLLIGKPFIVHLPSRPGAVNSGGGRFSLRIPDFKRIRLLP